MPNELFEHLKEQTREQSEREERQFRLLVPKSGFFSEYLRYTDRQESPGSFHFWTAATILGASLQRRAHVNKGIYDIYPNLYTVLVAPTGRCRKSRAIALGYGLIEKHDWLNVIADKTTPEQMLADLAGDPTATQNPSGGMTIDLQADSTGLIKSSELSTFLNKNTYSAGLVTILTDLFDNPSIFRYRLRSGKHVTLHNVALSMIGGSTPDWLASNLPETAFEGGFMSRIIFVVKFQRDRRIDWPEEPLKGEFDLLCKQVKDIRRVFRGRIEMAHDARIWHKAWYATTCEESTGDSQTDGFVERKPDTLLKVAILLSAAEEPTAKIVTVAHCRQALALLEWTQSKMFGAFQDIDLSRVGLLRKKIITMLEAADEYKLSRRIILRRLGGRILSIKELEEVEKIMEEADEISITIEGAGTVGRPSKTYKLKYMGGST